MNHLNPASLLSPADILETRFALRVTTCLSERTGQLSGDVAERLRFARERALQAAQQARVSGIAVHPVPVGGATVALGGASGWWTRLAAAAPLVALVCGLVLIQKSQTATQVAVAAEVDAALLSDDLPPSAYSDAGFVEFLKTSPHE